MLLEVLTVLLVAITGIFGDTRAVQYSIVDAGVDQQFDPGKCKVLIQVLLDFLEYNLRLLVLNYAQDAHVFS